MSKKYLQEALQSEKVDMDNLDINSVTRHIDEISKLEKMIDDFMASSDCPSHAFIRFNNVSFPSRVLFGKNIKYERGLELVLLPAKLVDGAWVPDENRALIKGLMAESDVTDMLFKSNRDSFTPITFTEIDGFTPEIPSAFYKPEQKFGKSFYKSLRNAEVEVERLLQQASVFQDSSVSLSKKNKEAIVEPTSSLIQFFGGDDDFDLKNDSESLNEHMLEVKKEVYTTLRAEAFKQDVPLKSKSDKCSRESIFKHYFDTHVDLSQKAPSSLLLARYADVLTEFSDREKRKNVRRESSWLGSEQAIANFNKSEYGKGGVTLSQVQSTSTRLFGEPHLEQDFMVLRLHFGVEELTHSGGTNIQDNGLLAYVNLSKTQLMDLIQSPFSHSYVKCTLNNICGQFVPPPEEAVSSRQRAFDLAKQYERPVSLIELLNDLNELLEGKGSSKAYRGKLLSLVEKIAEAAKPEFNKRIDAYLANRKVLGQDYLDTTIEELNNAIGVMAERNPELVGRFDEVMKRLI